MFQQRTIMASCVPTARIAGVCPAPRRFQIPQRHEMIDEKFLAKMIEARAMIPPEALELIREAHNELGWSCPAHSEGQACCMDLLLSKPPY
jgi:hypothetical protein